ncbi:MAG: glycerophosphodiester phosphodiesterase family protein [Hyphomonadaceae bacterium]|nr:glycerophosphodiester phosphodiesterase family protein [Hyphomonadaceae bacterium]
MPVLMGFFVASGCGQPADPTATASTEASAPLPIPATPSPAQPTTVAAGASLSSRLDCVRTAGGVLLIGHRGGPTRDYPENAIETFDRTYAAGTKVMEIDIAETKDGKLVLMHDDDLDRTTTGTGLVVDHTLKDIQALKLETGTKLTTFSPPTLEAALEWAVKTGAILELDKKRSAAFAPIIAAIRTAKAENNVFLITYTDDQAIDIHRQNPDLVITATIDTPARLDRLIAAGVKPENLIAWTGIEQPDPQLWQTLAARGIESAFGTTGARATSLDTLYWEDRDGSEYNDLVTDGLSILVTGLTDKTGRQLAAARQKSGACGL